MERQRKWARDVKGVFTQAGICYDTTVTQIAEKAVFQGIHIHPGTPELFNFVWLELESRVGGGFLEIEVDFVYKDVLKTSQ